MTRTKTEATNPTTTADPLGDLLYVLTALQSLVDEAAEQGGPLLEEPTPCDEFNVADLLNHVTFVARRVAMIGEGGHFDDVAFEEGNGRWSQMLAEATDAIKAAWADPAKLGQEFEVPFGRIPGFGVLVAYTSEFAVHGWDLAQAIGVGFDPDEVHLHAAYQGLTNIPAEGRDDPAMPFDPVAVPPTDATLLEKMAAYTGRRIPREA